MEVTIKKYKALTINVDASFIQTKKLASYAYWLSSDYGHWKGGSVFKDDVNDSTEAELKGIINALVVTFNEIKLRKINTIEQIYINCDSDTAIKVLVEGENVKSITGNILKYVPLFYIYKSVLEKNKFSNIVFKRIKGHSNGSKPRNYVNNWCDLEAKKLINKHIKILCKTKPVATTQN